MTATNDEAYDLLMDVAAGLVDDGASIRDRLASLTGPSERAGADNCH